VEIDGAKKKKEGKTLFFSSSLTVYMAWVCLQESHLPAGIIAIPESDKSLPDCKAARSLAF
jgi:hypothetical protein